MYQVCPGIGGSVINKIYVEIKVQEIQAITTHLVHILMGLYGNCGNMWEGPLPCKLTEPCGISRRK